MKKISILLMTSIVLPCWSIASAEEIQKFEIQKMTCAACPITVKKAMGKVAGVTSVSINFDTKIATVTYDETQSNAEAVAQASTNAGYPATLIR